MVEKEKENQEVSWNILSKRAEFISNLLWSATTNLSRYSYERTYASLNALRELINCDLKKADIEELDKLEKELRFWVCSKAEKKIKNSKLSVLVRTYQRKIMDCLKSQGYFPLKQDERFIGGVRK